MLALLRFLIVIFLLVAVVFTTVWYVRTPQPIGLYAQAHYAYQAAVYEYYDYERDDTDNALTYWQPLADQGNALAQTNISELYFASGEKYPENYKIAYGYLVKAANFGLPAAQNALGVMYRNGLGVDADKVEAWKWFDLSARQEFELAQKNLATSTQELTPKEQDQAKLRTDLWIRNRKKLWIETWIESL